MVTLIADRLKTYIYSGYEKPSELLRARVPTTILDAIPGDSDRCSVVTLVSQVFSGCYAHLIHVDVTPFRKVQWLVFYKDHDCKVVWKPSSQVF